MSTRRPVARCAVAIALALPVANVYAQERAPAAPSDQGEKKPLSHYEKETIERALERRKAVVDPAPQGKTIEAIDIETLDVLEDRDPLPTFARNILNFFHATTREGIVRQEVLQSVGDPYDERLVDETARNLRGFPRLSLVLIVPLRGSKPDSVRVLVITKDVWSLRLNTDYRVSTNGLEYLLLQPSEENLIGTHQAIAGQFILDPATYSLGGTYTVPRVSGSHLAFRASANAILNRETGSAEGSFGSFSYGQPLWSTQTEWAWGSQISWREEITRRYDYQHGRLFTYDAPATQVVVGGLQGNLLDRIPERYHSDLISGSEYVTRSFGTIDKNDFTLSMEVSRRQFRTKDLSAYSPSSVTGFVNDIVPVSDTRIGPAVEWHGYSTRFKSFLDFETMGLQEDYRLGHDLILKLYPVVTALNSSRNFFEVYAAALYTVPMGDGIVRAYIETDTEIEPSCPPERCTAQDDIPDASVDIGGRIVTPRFGIGRLILDAHLLSRYRNYLNDKSLLGGDTRLRGYPTQAFLGKDVVSGNLEFRSRPLELLTVQFGAVAFMDVGDAFDGFADMKLKQSVGGGLRVVFPQLDRLVMRIDWGIPVTRGYVEPDSFPGELVWTFRQAFSVPNIPVRQQSL